MIIIIILIIILIIIVKIIKAKIKKIKIKMIIQLLEMEVNYLDIMNQIMIIQVFFHIIIKVIEKK